jgi:hypothetical protein
MAKKGFFHHVSNLGKKVGGHVKRAFGFGKKMTEKVDGIHDKVKSAIGVASTVANILPVPKAVKIALSKAQDISAKVDKGTSLVKKGIERGTQLQAKAEQVGSILGAAKLGKEAFRAGRTGLKTTRSFLKRPQTGDNVSRRRVLDPGVSNGDRVAARKKSDTVLARNIRR